MLKGLKVIDLSSVLAGPSVATFFAELGASVVKIEHPIHKDVTRTWKLPDEDPNSEISAYFASVNFGKEYLFLDLTKEEDYLNFLNLIFEADILIMNFKKGDDIKLRLQDELLLGINPRLIIGKINGYGDDSDRVAYDLVLQGECDFMAMNGTYDSGPVKMPVALIDVLAAHHLKEAILLALYAREKNGNGKVVTVSLYDAAISSLMNQASNYLMRGQIPKRIGSLHPNIAPYGELFRTADGAHIVFAIGSDRHFKKLCTVLGLLELPEKEEFSSNQNRVKNRERLASLIAAQTEKLQSEKLLEVLHSEHIPAGKIMDLKEVFDNERAKALIREECISDIPTARVASYIFK
ncbi:CaiB/BaiF CoA transferase family protein [Legionella longbeachae]|uniref:Putative predicted acyl-CoA transferases n=1 Tax=Legionella longbeachae serogroup 1 (strain NSW150) TaxID=661367 RepID=D3HRN4_LEGLN|nr:CoA transferase [Legionella longbeachae]VEE02067.1 acyl-CoA transferase [Legionella oakridgensis]ARB91631.1 CoA transferase [Legionella longbeachae]EEZ95320.1 putative acyl CoA transferase/carnitine dehydratase [Legionella longbeachae D-4968]QIN31953.1 CoA transferase [Legionella longbeachae]QIN35298.1 CoA transferase [Legionella longbeachae]